MIEKTIQIQDITVEELADKIADKLLLKLETYLDQLAVKKEDDIYLTRKETAAFLKINITTVHNWTKRGKLKAHGLGNRVYYKKSDLKKALIRIN